ncbi:MAG: DUF805 domain-containing protein [Chloroflexota bacterium]|jgi:uncharacterized membrane protein YhaH (DUF805 family)|nr:DUF805 domain-containing protein [Chloroflexota bacterium]MDP6507829.1 DUF805 domain-containing protein [Chloroflexota bacterium]MDP6757629.1 DUF805 domain-containing protein [Chloroflexota bacterium]|tara:strand:+ start:325 stop:672 length:348 start_codon:yes stop_codon:yes gene_type:complete
MDWYLGPIKKYAVFSGRASRAEFWLWVLSYWVVTLVLVIVGEALATGLGQIVGILHALTILIPNIAVTVRRLHDTERSGWWILISLIPIVGNIAFFIFMVLRGTDGENLYGPSPD